MPTVVVLILACIGGANATVVAVKNSALIVHALKAVHHHTTLPLYHHVLKPVGKAVSE